jgi:hypothetical protein
MENNSKSKLNFQIILSTIGVLVGIAGLTWQIYTKDEEKSVKIIKVQTPTHKIEFPKFEGQIQPYNESDFIANGKKCPNSQKFNDFMMENEGKIVYLDIWPYYTDEDLDRYDDKEDNVFGIDPLKGNYFTIFNEPFKFESGGNAYIIKGIDSGDLFVDGRGTARRIKGYVKILGFAGPNQGIMTATLKPVSLEAIEALKK